MDRRNHGLQYCALLLSHMNSETAYHDDLLTAIKRAAMSQSMDMIAASQTSAEHV